MVVQARRWCADLVMREQRRGAAGVLGRNDRDFTQHANRPEGHVLQVADGCGDQEERSGHGGGVESIVPFGFRRHVFVRASAAFRRRLPALSAGKPSHCRRAGRGPRARRPPRRSGSARHRRGPALPGRLCAPVERNRPGRPDRGRKGRAARARRPHQGADVRPRRGQDLGKKPTSVRGYPGVQPGDADAFQLRPADRARAACAV